MNRLRGAGQSSEAPPAEGQSHVVQVAVGSRHALILTDEGIVYSWGSLNDHGYLGRQADPEGMLKPTPLIDTFRAENGALEVINQISCGLEHCLALSKDGKLYSWGRNQAGQLGIEGYAPGKLQKAEVPTPVCRFEGGQASMMARNCTCGPESSACVATTGDIYVWGAVSFHMFANGKRYDPGDNCTIPVKLRSVPLPATITPTERYFPGKLAVWSDKVAGPIVMKSTSDDLMSLIDLRKLRASILAKRSRSRKQDAKSMRSDKDGAVELEDLRQLNADYKDAREKLVHELKTQQERLKVNTSELRRVNRELTICDQQDTAYNEGVGQLELKKSELSTGQGKQRDVHLIDSQLNDIAQFKAANRKNKVDFLAQRDKLEQENWKLHHDLNVNKMLMAQADARSQLLRALQTGDVGKTGNSTVDDGLRIAASKREELAATYPEILCQGRFSSFREALQISDRSLQDVSSALKEVSAAASGGDGVVLEEVLELNLKMRKEFNALISDKLQSVDNVEDPNAMLVKFFYEVHSGQDASSRQLDVV